MAFSFVQSKGGGGTSPVSNTYSSNLTIGSLLVAAVYWNSSTATCTVSDGINGAWTAAGGPQTGIAALSAWRLQLFYFLNNNTAVATTVTATVSSAVSAGLAIHEYLGTSVSVDGTPAYNTPTGTTVVTSGTVTTTVAGTLLFLAGVAEVSANAAGAGFVQREGLAFGGNITEDDLDGGAAGGKTGSFSTNSTVDANIIGLMAFKESLSTTSRLTADHGMGMGRW